MKVLMVGATGRFAGLVLPELTRRDVVVRALVRDEAGAAEARGRGAAETTRGDLREPATLRAAAEGVDGVFHLNPAFAEGEAEMGVGMVRAASAAGVRRFVFSSVYHPSLSLTNHAAKQPVEEALYESSMEYTVLQPAMFMQLLAGSFSDAARHGRISGSYSKRSNMSYVDYRDVAEAAALALTRDEPVRGTFELSAPGMWDRVEVAALLSRVLGREVSAEQSPPGDAGVARAAPGPLRDGLARMTEHYDAHGFSGGNALVLRAVLGREPRTLEAYFRELAGDRIAV
ncbi:MAG: UDP-glucose 4-epimerase, partial [uncultured Solirubrobacteraceae bacterium]